jgi:hypothetical protein
MTDKTEIAQWLQTMLHEHLFGPKPWPVSDHNTVHEQLLGWGLIEYSNATDFHSSALGAELDVHMWTMLIGHHELGEIPHYLADRGLISQEQADHIVFQQWEEDGERLEDILSPILRRVYRAMHGSVS